MKKVLFWILALIITLLSAIYQRLTGPTYPFSGKVSFLGQEIKFRLPRSAENTDNCRVVVRLPENLAGQVKGYLRFKRYKTRQPWNILSMEAQENRLVGFLPKQPAAGKLEYYVHLLGDSQEISLTGEKPIIIRFKGPVSSPILIAHIITMFLAMLFSVRAGLAAANRNEELAGLARWTALLLFIGGFILGPIVQKMAFGTFWSGFPVGHDLTDNKSLVAMLAWIAALASGRKRPIKRSWVIAAAVITLVAYLIPHSLLGSEIR